MFRKPRRPLQPKKRSRFFPTKVFREFYFYVILPSVKYGLIVWGACRNFGSVLWNVYTVEHAARIIFNLPKDIASCDVLEGDHWHTLF